MKWYSSGLRFECAGCGGCCAGPQSGYIWITADEIEKLAAFLDLTAEQVRQKYLTLVGRRCTIIEDKNNKDCIFLKTNPNGKRGCSIYPVRPNQCRTWPFWAENLSGPLDWELAGRKCPGIDKGRLYSLEEIERLNGRKGRQGD